MISKKYKEVVFSKEELRNKIKEKYADIQIDWNSENAIQIQEYTDSGRVRTIKFGNISIAGTEARDLANCLKTFQNLQLNYTKNMKKILLIISMN